MQDHNPPPSPAEQAAPELVENVTTPASAEAPVAEERVGDTLPSLSEQLRQTELKGAEHHGAWLLQPELVLNAEQRSAFEAVRAGAGRFHPCLLAGVTGSGKTEVYLQLIRETLEAG